MIQDTGTVGVFVTHDPEEVMAIGDHVVVLDHGRIVQQGEPQSLYDAPESLYVAQLFGDSQTLDGTLDERGLTTPFGTWDRDCLVDPGMADGAVTIVLHPHRLTLQPATNGARIREIRPAGARDRLLVQGSLPDSRLVIERPREPGASPDVGAHVRIEPDAGTVFAAGSSRLANENDSH